MAYMNVIHYAPPPQKSVSPLKKNCTPDTPKISIKNTLIEAVPS